MISCRFCESEVKLSLIDLGVQPLANSYISLAQKNQNEPRYPLQVRVCQNCRLAQVEAATAPENIFSDYAYFSSYSKSWVEHAKRYTEMACKRFSLDQHSKVVEIASNDGYLLQHFVARNIPVLGVEPAANVAKVAIEKNIPTDISFFGLETAQRLKLQGHSADLIAGNNVYAHVPDINDFTAGIACLLKPDGIVTLEFPHLLQLLKHNQFDTIYHEHYSYLLLMTVEKIFDAHGLRVFDVEELSTHGGSLRIFGCLKSNQQQKNCPGLNKVRLDEEREGLAGDEPYKNFEIRTQTVRENLLDFLTQAAEQGKTIAAYGAAAKGNTLLNYCGISSEQISFVVDRSPHKQGTLLPGSHIPVYPPEALFEYKPDYVLILPWNLQEEISQDMAGISAWGGQFFVAIPQIKILSMIKKSYAV